MSLVLQTLRVDPPHFNASKFVVTHDQGNIPQLFEKKPA